jgi:hypothetical protein
MFTYECILAAALFSAPKEAGDSIAALAWIDAARPSLLAAAMELEVLDGREREHYLAPKGNRADDFQLLLNKAHYFASMPVLEECRRFPSRQVINEYLAFNRAYRADLQKRLVIDPFHSEELRLAIYETDQLYSAWDTLRDARCEYYYVTVRRQALQNLKDTIGAEAFYSGRMPPHIPTWHFPMGRN